MDIKKKKNNSPHLSPPFPQKHVSQLGGVILQNSQTRQLIYRQWQGQGASGESELLQSEVSVRTAMFQVLQQGPTMRCVSAGLPESIFLGVSLLPS